MSELPHEPMIDDLQDVLDRLDAEIVADDDPIQRYTRSRYKNATARVDALASYQRELKAIKDGYDDVVAELDRWERAIDNKHGPAAWAELDNRLKLQRARFVPTLWGRLCKRKKPGRIVRRIRIGHEKALKEWAIKYCPEAIISSTTTEVDKELIPVTCSEHVYDETIEEQDNFIYELPKAKQEKNNEQ